MDLSLAADLAQFASEPLKRARDGQPKPWRMLEYWWQVELFWRLRRGDAAGWRVLGDYEYPYWTACSRSKQTPTDGGAATARSEAYGVAGPKYGKPGVKWIDLVMAGGDRGLFIEMKDLGRSRERLRENAFGVGKDLAALHHALRAATLAELRSPGEATKDQDRMDDFKGVATDLEGCKVASGAVLVMYERGSIEDEMVAACIRRRYVEWAGISGDGATLDPSGPVSAGEFMVQAMSIALPRWATK
jgi:hypothetical protein